MSQIEFEEFMRHLRRVLPLTAARIEGEYEAWKEQH